MTFALSLSLARISQLVFEGRRNTARPKFLACEKALIEHLPELIPTYQKLAELAGGGDMEARLLGLYKPTPYLTDCSQAVWTQGGSILVRNYDYSPKLWEGIL